MPTLFTALDLTTVFIAAMWLIGLALLLWWFWQFVGPAYRFCVRFGGVPLIILLLYSLIYGLIGTSLGLPYLFWHENFRDRVGASTGATLLLGLIGVIAFYMDRYPLATGERTKAWLAADERLWNAGSFPLWNWLRTIFSKEEHIGRLDKGAFILNAVFFDLPFFLIPRLQRFFEPYYSNTKRMARFLRTCRTPFLLLLLAPAVFPDGFPWVPKIAPAFASSAASTTWLGREIGALASRIHATDSDPARDVNLGGLGWGIGLLAWWLGIVLGVTIIKIYFRASEWPWQLLSWARGEKSSDLSPEGPITARLTGCENAQCPSQGCPYLQSNLVVARPKPCKARSDLIKMNALFFVLAALVYLAMGADTPIYEDFVSPAFAICAALGIVAMVYALIAFQTRNWQFPALLLIVGYLGFANHNAYKTRFENMNYDAAKLVPLRERVDAEYVGGVATPKPSASPPFLAGDETARNNWLAKRKKDSDAVGGKPKLVVVAVSGGATRSAYWSATVLDRVEREIKKDGGDFGSKVRIITGASGGMLGTAYYVVHRRAVAEKTAEPISWVETVPINSMKPLAKYIALREIWQSLCPMPLAWDRGVVIERDWSKLRLPIHDLRDLEEKGEIPSLIFSPMIIEDGRRLLISNLDLGRMVDGSVPTLLKSRGHLVSDQSAGEVVGDYSLSAIELFRMFPEAKRFFLSTAVRMSASFPYVSPAVNLPSDPPRRVVDAGYYDNYGVEVASAWIYQNRDWLATHTSGVLLLQVRDSISVKERLDVDDNPPTFSEWALRGFQFFFSPIDGASSARYSSSAFRDDQDVDILGDVFTALTKGKVARPESFFTTAIFENSATVTLRPPPDWPDEDKPLENKKKVKDGEPRDVSMTWYLTRAEIQALNRAIPGDPPSGSKWADPKQRRALIDYLRDQVFQIPPSEDKDKSGASTDKSAEDKGLPPGPTRDARFKQLERLRNYERLQNLKRWWKEAGAPK